MCQLFLNKYTYETHRNDGCWVYQKNIKNKCFSFKILNTIDAEMLVVKFWKNCSVYCAT